MAVKTDKKLIRGKERMVLGVCSGVADYFGLDVTIVRLGYVLLTVFTGFIFGLIAYVIAAAIMPEK